MKRTPIDTATSKRLNGQYYTSILATLQPVDTIIAYSDSPISSAALSFDGKRIITGLHNKNARIWEIANLAKIRSYTLSGHAGSVNSVAMSANGKFAFTGSDDGTAKLWTIAGPTTGTLVTLSGSGDRITTIAISPQGNFAAAGAHDGTVILWKSAKSDTFEKSTLAGHHDSVNALAFSPNGRFLVSGSSDKTIILRDMSKFPEIESYTIPIGFSVNTVAWSPNNMFLFVAGENKELVAVNVSHPAAIQQYMLADHTAVLKSVAVSPDGAYLLTTSVDGTVRLWNIQATNSGISYQSWVLTHGNFDPVTAFFSHDGKQALIVSADSARLYSLWGVTVDKLAALIHLKTLYPPRARQLLTTPFYKDIFSTLPYVYISRLNSYFQEPLAGG